MTDNEILIELQDEIAAKIRGLETELGYGAGLEGEQLRYVGFIQGLRSVDEFIEEIKRKRKQELLN